MENLYQVLGVNENATLDEIKKSYKEKAKILHPDVGGNEDEFKTVNNAYQILSDENKRKEYDFKRQNPNHSFQNFGGFYDPFKDAVNEFMHRQNRQHQELQIGVALTLKEVLLGGTKRILFNKKMVCSDCRGSGKEKTETCPICNGQGMVSHRVQRGPAIFETIGPCQHCQGSGQISSGPNCVKCNGVGYLIEPQDLQIDIPVGMPYGIALRLANKGNDNGNLNVIFTPDASDKYERIGDDIAGIVELTYPEMMLGIEKNIDIIDGVVKVKINKYSKPDDKVRLKGLGLPNYHHKGRGDLFLILRLKTITELTPNEEKILKSLLKEKNFKS